MKKYFVTYEIAKKLKELGFNEPCMAYYGQQNFNMGLLFSNVYNGNAIETCIAEPRKEHLDVFAPLWEQAIEWFETKKIKVRQSFVENKWNIVDYSGSGDSLIVENKPTIEEAILKAIELYSARSN